MRGLATTSALFVLLALFQGPVSAATRYDPALRFRSIATTHFVIHYHQGEEPLALRLASMVEGVHEDLARRLGHAPRSRTHVVLVDQDDDPNGWTTPLPYNLIEIGAAPPSGASIIGNTDDWLRLVFTHEYAHVLHLDLARGWARAARHVFGRAFFAFPNLTTPEWQIEGVATYFESRGGQGRIPAGDFRNILGVAARTGRLEAIDRVNGGLVAWPAGYGWYAYGAYFHQYLADRFGEQTLAALSARTSGRLPYFTSGAFRAVFGESLGTLWQEFEASERARAATVAATASDPVRRTFSGYLTDGPRFDTDGAIVFTRQDAHEFPSIERVASGGRVERLATRYGGTQSSVGREAVYFDQLEFVQSVGLVSDLYRLDRATGRVTRLTHNARLSEPDLSPDGRRLAAIRTGEGHRSLVILDREALERGGASAARAIDEALVVGGPDEVMANPRWSRDGLRIAVESRERHGPSSIVLVHPDDPARREVIAESNGRNVTPSWTPDGRTIVFASDRDGGAFNVYCVPLDADGRSRGTAQQVTHLAGGARSPDVSPDGRTLALIGYTTKGHDVFTLPFACPAVAAGAQGGLVGSYLSTPDESTAQVPASTPYRPWSTLGPRTWLPIVDTSDDEVRVGAATGSIDALGYHAWTASATWSVARRAELDPVAPGVRPDLLLGYQYDRWRPVFFTQYGDETTPLLVHADKETVRPVAVRERAVDAGVVVPVRRVRVSQSFLASYRFEHDTISGPEDDGRVERGAMRLGWSLSSAKRYGYSISPEGGVSVGLGVEQAAPALGSDGTATFVRGDMRAYLPLGPRHAVLALRATGARSTGDRGTRRVLRLGGSDGDAAVISFDEDASSLLRGFESGQFAGSRVALVNAEYRVPLTWIQRGVGTWPFFLRSVHAAVFFDAGDAWSSDSSRLDQWKRSWGGELSTDVVAGFVLPLTLTAGVGWGRDGEGLAPPTRTAYVRVGHAF